MTNKDIATELFARFSVSDIGGVMALLSEDVTWRVAGKPELWSGAGLYDRARLKRLFRRMLTALNDAGMQMEVTGAVAEGERVALEVKSTAELRNGRKYRQRHHFLMSFRDGKISQVREYLDTHHAYETWSKRDG